MFFGAFLAFALIDGVSTLIGKTIALLVSPFWINLGASIVFMIFGIYTLIATEKEKIRLEERPFALASSVSLISLMELGDKTQLAVIALTAEYDTPVLVFLGVMIAFTIVTGLSVTLGAAIS